MNFSTFMQVVFDGLAIGLVYVFMAAGFNLILSVTNVFFVAFGMFYALGAYITWALVQVGTPFFAAVVAASLLTAAGGAVVYLLVMRKSQCSASRPSRRPSSLRSCSSPSSTRSFYWRSAPARAGSTLYSAGRGRSGA